MGSAAGIGGASPDELAAHGAGIGGASPDELAAPAAAAGGSANGAATAGGAGAMSPSSLLSEVSLSHCPLFCFVSSNPTWIHMHERN